jgi:hypothetical protein
MSESDASESKDWKPTPRQVDRYERTKKKLQERKVPHLTYPLYIEDEDEVTLREGPKVARRILVLGMSSKEPRERARKSA